MPVANISGLILSGGGARAAYQVGVLKAIDELMAQPSLTPFPVLCGTSAGAINTTVLACHAGRFHKGVQRLEKVWQRFHCHHIYRTDLAGLMKNSGHWLLTQLLFSGQQGHPVSLLDNRPLRQLLQRVIRFERIDQALYQGLLRAVSITASGYSSAESVSFFQGQPDIAAWHRARRSGCPARLGVQHLLASSAIPMVFPATLIHREYFGDGALRNLAPLSPALHLGANRLLIVSVDSPAPLSALRPHPAYPSLAEIAGQLLDSAFVDGLSIDLERLIRINRTLSQLPTGTNQNCLPSLRPIQHLMISPSQDIAALANQHLDALPRTLKFFFSFIGATQKHGSLLLSYLLFEPPYLQSLMELGYQDALRQQQAIRALLSTENS